MNRPALIPILLIIGLSFCTGMACAGLLFAPASTKVATVKPPEPETVTVVPTMIYDGYWWYRQFVQTLPTGERILVTNCGQGVSTIILPPAPVEKK